MDKPELQELTCVVITTTTETKSYLPSEFSGPLESTIKRGTLLSIQMEYRDPHGRRMQYSYSRAEKGVKNSLRRV